MSDTIDKKPDDELSEGAKDVVRILRWFFTVLTVLMLGCLAYYFVSGIFILESGEHAAVFRFGAWKDSKKTADWYWAMPKYIDRVEEVSVTKRHSFESTYFWYKEEPKTALDNPGQPRETDDAQLEVGKDGYHLTADNNIMHSKWSLSYRVDNLKDYLTRYENPEETVHLSLKNAILKASSQLKIDQIQSDGGSALRVLVKKELLRSIIDMKVGVEILELNLLKLSVPLPTIKAFESVRDAANQRDKYEKNAIGYASSEQEKAQASARKIIEKANAYKQNVQDSVVADAEYMSEILPQYRQFGASILLTEYVDTLVNVLDEVEQVEIVHPGQDIRITFEPRLDVKSTRSDTNEHKEH